MAMTNQPLFPDPPDPSARVSPVRPPRPTQEMAAMPADVPATSSASERPASPPPTVIDPTSDPDAALVLLRRKIERVADEFSAGQINRGQFNAMYKRYSEQRTIIERLIARNPESDAWKQVISVPGQTGFLRSQYAAMPIACSVYLHDQLSPMLKMGPAVMDDGTIARLLMRVWAMPVRPPQGMGRRALPGGEWMLMATGLYAATLVIFSQEPSITQAYLIRDQHADFERANLLLLTRGSPAPEKMVFPQRALLEVGG